MRDPLVTTDAIASQPACYELFMALRLLECAYPQRARIGTAARPRDEALRFAQRPALTFEPAMIASLLPDAQTGAQRLTINSFGLLGANGPMPSHFTEYVRNRVHNANDTTLAGFLDLIHHRLISLFYRAWAQTQPTVSMDRPDDDRFSTYVASLIGLGAPALRQRDDAPDFAKLHFSGRLAAHTHNAEGLEAMLSSFFQAPVRLHQFIGSWMRLPHDGLTHLYTTGRGPARQLGLSTVLGRRVWNCQDKFRVVIGPLNLYQYRRFLPGSEGLKRLTVLIHSYVGLAFQWDVNLALKKAEVPPLRLGSDARLGRTSWLQSRPPQQDDRQMIVRHATCIRNYPPTPSAQQP